MRTAAVTFITLFATWIVCVVVPDDTPGPFPRPSQAIPGEKLAWLIDQGVTATRVERLWERAGVLLDPVTGEAFNGVAADDWPDGTRKLIVEVRDGTPHGGSIGFHADGSVAFVRNNVRGVPYGLVLEYDAAGELRLEAIAMGRHLAGGVKLDALRGPAVEGPHQRHGRGLRAHRVSWRHAISDADVRDETYGRGLHLPKHAGERLQ